MRTFDQDLLKLPAYDCQWTDVDSAFKDLIRGLNSLESSRRLTVRQALDHPWFEGIETFY